MQRRTVRRTRYTGYRVHIRVHVHLELQQLRVHVLFDASAWAIKEWFVLIHHRLMYDDGATLSRSAEVGKLWFLQYRLGRLVIAWLGRSGRFDSRCGDGYLRWGKWFGHGRAEWLPKSIGRLQVPHPKTDDRQLGLGSRSHTNSANGRSRTRPLSLYARGGSIALISIGIVCDEVGLVQRAFSAGGESLACRVGVGHLVCLCVLKAEAEAERCEKRVSGYPMRLYGTSEKE